MSRHPDPASRGSLARLWRALALLWAVVSLPCAAQEVPGDSASTGEVVATRLGVDGFLSLTDGQPGDAGTVEAETSGAYLGASAWNAELSVAYTPGGGALARNALVSLTAPSITVGEGATDAEASLAVGWQQRWRYSRSGPSVSTALSVLVPYARRDSARTDLVATLVLAQTAGPVALYVNAYAETTDGLGDLAATEWGLLAGVKLLVAPEASVTADALYQRGGTLTVELAAGVETLADLTLGPGLALTFADDAPAALTGGLVVSADL